MGEKKNCRARCRDKHFFGRLYHRIKLYSEIQKLGDAVLYHDTDRIIYATRGQNDRPLGNFLGEFTDELDGNVITQIVSGGSQKLRLSHGEEQDTLQSSRVYPLFQEP